MRTQRLRLKYSFWLDVLQDDEKDLVAIIRQLKGERMFTEAIRKGLTLYYRLRNKDYRVLWEMFAWWPDWFEGEVQARIAEDRERRGDGDNDLLDRIEYLERLVARLEANSGGYVMSEQPGPRPLGAPQLAKPKYDDDADDVALLKASARKDMSTDSAENFLKSMMNLQAGFDKQQ